MIAMLSTMIKYRTTEQCHAKHDADDDDDAAADDDDGGCETVGLE